MTGTVSPAIPTVGQPDSTEEPKIPSAIITLRDALNAILTGSNQVDGAQVAAGTIPNSALAAIALSKLVAGSNTQIPISNGTAFVAKTLTGDVTVTNAGVTAIGAGKVDTAEIADGAVGAAKLALTGQLDTLAATTSLTGSYQTVCSLPVSNGNYLVDASVCLIANVGGNVTVNLRYNAADHETEQFNFASTVKHPVNVSTVAVVSSGATIDLKVKGATTLDAQGADAAGGLTTTRLRIIRYA